MKILFVFLFSFLFIFSCTTPKKAQVSEVLQNKLHALYPKA